MSEARRKTVLAVAIIWVVILAGAAAAFKFLILPGEEEDLLDATGTESQYKQTVTLAADAFSGYAVLRSEAMRAQTKTFGLKLEIEDDKADYVGRMKALEEGRVQMAVFTVDALLTAGHDIDSFPASIVMIIDETTGADAIVAYKPGDGSAKQSGLANLQALDQPGARIVATPSSPSEFLARTVIATLSLPSLPEKWLVEADGARHRLLKAPADHEPVVPASTTLLAPMADLAVLGKPLTDTYVHRAKRAARLLGVPPGEPITPTLAARLLAHPQGGLKGAPETARLVPILTWWSDEPLTAAAQETADRLVAGGIRGILNFSPTVPEVPDTVHLRNVNLTIELEGLSFAIREEEAAGRKTTKKSTTKEDA